jgi:GDP-fucose protein O-fucosyltransferase
MTMASYNNTLSLREMLPSRAKRRLRISRVALLAGILVTTTIYISWIWHRLPEQEQSQYDDRDGSEWLTFQLFNGPCEENFPHDPRTDSKHGQCKAQQPARVGLTQKSVPKLGTLQCDAHGGPMDPSVVQEMIYWRDIPQDRKFVSSYHRSSPREPRKYVSVELDAGGFNNIRMTVEIAMALAHATGRTFVIPPRQGIYLLEETYSLHDFYQLDGLDVIEMKEFIEQEVIPGNIRDRNGLRVSPPGNRTNWAGAPRGDSMWEDNDSDLRHLDRFLRKISISPKTTPGEKVFIVPAKPTSEKQLRHWKQYLREFKKEPDPSVDELRRTGDKWADTPTPVNAPAKDRFEEIMQFRRPLLYTDQIHDVPLLHFMSDDEKLIRFMSHFYHALFFEDWRMDLVVKRYVRDRLRYRDEYFCAAARIVESVREISRNAGNEGRFYTFHIRRNDFAHIDLIKSADDILSVAQDVIPPGATVYVATDEREKTTWFEPFQERFRDVLFLDDFVDRIEYIKPSFYGILDQIVAARGEIFVGAFYSTFTAQINHMRGYYSQSEKKSGWQLGLLDSYFYAPEEVFDFYQRYRAFGEDDPVNSAYPIAWRDIDRMD